MKKRANTPKEDVFIREYKGYGDGERAAIAAGYSPKRAKQWAWQLLRKPHIFEAIEKRRKQLEQQTIKQEAKLTAKAITVTRNDIINGLHTEAAKAESDSARVTAWGKLADIFKLTDKGPKDADLFSGWTDQELEHYRITGQLPPRFGLSANADGNDANPTDPLPSTS